MGKLKDVKLKDGGDRAEDVLGALYMANKKWNEYIENSKK